MQGDSRTIVRHYLAAPAGSFWRWEEDGSAIAWSDGSTIAFRDELEVLLPSISGRALPPMGALVLTLAACRSTWGQQSAGRTILRKLAISLDGGDPRDAKRIGTLLTNVLSGLDRIHRLRAEQRSTPEAKVALIQTLFESSGREPDLVSAAMAEQLRQGLAGLDLQRPSATPLNRADFTADLVALHDAFWKFDAGTLPLRARTGLDELPAAPPETEEVLPPLPASVRARRLLDSLRADPELSALAKLARDVMAAVQIPRPVSAPERVPTGGVSDITNRGTLDRLLVSELAHDSLTLAVRVALGEAIYLHRECPPETPRGHRFVLIDCGIRLWGLPRLFAAAVALALAATTDPRHELRLFRSGAEAKSLVPVDVTRREGLIELLAALEFRPHPGPSLVEMLAQARASSGEASGVEAIFVTHPDVLADPELCTALQALGDDHLYTAAVERDGELQLAQVSRAGSKPLKRARVKLEELFSEPRSTESARRSRLTTPTALPAAISAESFPLLLPITASGLLTAQHERHGTIAVSHRWLIHCPAKGKGWRRLKHKLSEGKTLWIGLGDDGVAHAVIAPPPRQPGVHLVSQDVEGGEGRVISLGSTPILGQGTFMREGLLCVVGADKTVRAHSMVDGRCVASLRLLARFEHSFNGRFFCSDRNWHSLQYQSGQLYTDSIPGNLSSIRFLIEQAGPEGVVGLRADGAIVDLFNPSQPVLHASLLQGGEAISIVEAVSPGGELLLVRTSTPDGSWLFDYKQRQRWLITPNRPEQWVNYVVGTRPRHSLRTKFEGVDLDADGLLLRSPGGRHAWRVGLNASVEEWFLQPVKPYAPGRTPLHFVPIRSRNMGWGVSMRVATFADGSKVFLDSRGLLHLKSSDTNLPEITFALTHQAAMAGWVSDGRTFGDPYFYEGQPTAKSAEIKPLIDTFLGRLR